MKNFAIETVNLSKTYRTVAALTDVSLQLEAGKIYGLVGNNGAGKTTLFRILTGLITPSGGSFSLLGKTGKEINTIRPKIGALIENPIYHKNLTPRQNLEAQAILLGLKDKERIQEVLRMVGMDKDTLGREPKLKDCSMGMKQRFGLASALLNRPELLILDEPVNGLDPAGILEIREFLLELNRREGLTILISSHILDELYRLATDFIFLNHGHVIQEITHAELEPACEAAGGVENYFLNLVGKKGARHETTAS